MAVTRGMVEMLVVQGSRALQGMVDRMAPFLVVAETHQNILGLVLFLAEEKVVRAVVAETSNVQMDLR